MSTPLRNVPELSSHLRRLHALGYHTYEELVETANIEPDRLSGFLGVDVPAVLNALQQTLPAQAPSPAEMMALAEGTYTLGVDLSAIPMNLEAFDIAETMPAAAGAPVVPATSFEFSSDFQPVKNQLNRGTCVAFSSVAALEQYHFSVLGTRTVFSEQFLYWNCKQNDGKPSQSGTWVGVSYPLLVRNGCCLDATWGYVGNDVVGNESQTPPPPNAVTEAAAYRIPGVTRLAPTSVAAIKAVLTQRRAVTFSIPVFNSWYLNNAVRLSGNIVMPLPGEIGVGGHALCMVGYVETAADAAVGGGRFILRNSWNGSWGVNFKMPDGTAMPGYGTIPYAYIAQYGAEAYSIA